MKRQSFRVGIVGATGAVGQELIQLLHTRKFPLEALRLLASSRSVGKTLCYNGQRGIVEEMKPEVFSELDIAIFSAGASLSRDLAPEAVKRNCVVIDNSSAFRQDPAVPLVVPEINGALVAAHRGIIANPNCSTAIALMGLYPLHQCFQLKRFFACTYQAVSGSGVAAIKELEAQTRAWVKDEPIVPTVYPYPIAFNLLPHVDDFLPEGYTREEMKLLNESRKILALPDLRASVTCVRVPVLRAHAIALHAEFVRPVNVAQARRAIAEFPGVELCDDLEHNRYPMPQDYSGRVACGVGRLRRDCAWDNGLALWVVGDQLWKGAALNAVQIAELLVSKND